MKLLRVLPSLLAVAMLTACANESGRADRLANQARALNPAIDACIRHARDGADVAADLRAAGFSQAQDGSLRRAFAALDNALSTQGFVTVDFREGCTVRFPIHMMAIQESDVRTRARLSEAGFQPTSDPRANTRVTGRVPYTNGETKITVNAFRVRDTLTGIVSNLTFRLL